MMETTFSQAERLQNAINTFDDLNQTIREDNNGRRENLQATWRREAIELLNRQKTESDTLTRQFETETADLNNLLTVLREYEGSITDRGYAEYHRKNAADNADDGAREVSAADSADSITRCRAAIAKLNNSKLPQWLSVGLVKLGVSFRGRQYREIKSSINDSIRLITKYSQDVLAKYQTDTEAMNTRHTTEETALIATYNERLAGLNTYTSALTASATERFLSDIQWSVEPDSLFIRKESASISGASPSGWYADAGFTIGKTDITIPDGCEVLGAIFNRLFPDKTNGNKLSIPVILDAEKALTHCVIYPQTPDNNTAAESARVHFVNSAINAFTMCQPGTIRVFVADAARMGEEYTPLKRLEVAEKGKTAPLKIARTAVDAERMVKSVYDEMCIVQSSVLSSGTPSLAAYNEQARIKKPYTALVIPDVSGMNSATLSYLLSIARNGARCGVHLLFGCCTGADGGSREVRDFIHNINSLNLPILKAEDTGKFRYGNHNAVISPSDALTEEIAMSVCDIIIAAINRTTDIVSIREVLSEDTGDASTALSIPIGFDSQNRVFDLNFSSENAHALITGEPNSGKSSLLHTLILSAVRKYSRDDLNLQIVDLKNGDEFSRYAGVIPHVNLILTDDSGEAAVDYLGSIKKEIIRRSEIFRSISESGSQKIEKYEAYREYRTTHPQIECIPRMMIIIDEFQSMFSSGPAYANAAAESLLHICRMGRTYGIHLVMASQQVRQYDGTNTFSSGIRDYFTMRICTRCSVDEAKILFGDCCADTGRPNEGINMAPTLAVGSAIINSRRGSVNAENKYVQVAYASDGEREENARACHNGEIISCLVVKKTDMAYFDEKALKRIELSASSDETSYILGKSNRVYYDTVTGSRDVIGDNGYVSVSLGRTEGNNILLSGYDEISVYSFLDSFMQNNRHRKTKCLVFASDDAETNHHELMTLLRDECGCEVVSGEGDICGRLSELSKAETQENTICIFIGLQQLRYLHSGSYSALKENTPPSDFVKLLLSGPERGINSIVWTDNVSALYQSFSRQTLDRAFALRFATAGAQNLIVQALSTQSSLANMLRVSDWMLNCTEQPKIMYMNTQSGKNGTFRPFSGN